MSRAAEYVDRTVQCASPVGLHRMAYREWGAADNPRVLICVHGLTRNGQDFDPLASALASEFRVICPDIVGRGRSEWLPSASLYGIPQYVADMVTLIARLDVECVSWLGTSLGGLVGMALASLDGSPVSRLLLNDLGPRIEAVALRRIADYLGRAPRFASEEDAERYIRQVGAPYGSLSGAQWRHLTRVVLRRVADGGFELNFDPAIAESFRLAIAGGDIDLWPVYERIRCPTLLVRGELSDLLSRETAQAMAERGPRPRVIEVPRVGHAPMFLDEAQIAIARDFFLGD